MPEQNRVTPFGEIIATPHRGTFMGNRGVLHDDDGAIKRQYALERWIICVLEFKNRRRPIMQPGRYTELFFLDEATAMAAGHRPCAECRRADYNRFKRLWLQANRDLLAATNPRIEAVDHIIQRERIDADGQQVTYNDSIDNLPDGVMITLPGRDVAYLVWQNRLHEWSPAGYQRHRNKPENMVVRVLTPRSIVRTIAAGYTPEVHSSVR
ncbi:MAG: hypothetical protein D6737_02980 [Chloroflexi bacterium]|nr:MAG: hypothetical protein D6737_02980 [Chloroflexota bacterium]